jgi:RNA polymerase sigma factor (sigma-70 family)
VVSSRRALGGEQVISADAPLTYKSAAAKFNALVHKIARRFGGAVARGGLDFADLVQEGHIGLMKAVDAYRAERGPFVSFAWSCINHAMSGAVGRVQGRMVDGVNPRAALLGAASLDAELSGDATLHDLLGTDATQEDEYAASEARRRVLDRLTVQERAVVEMMSRGTPEDAIAKRLGVARWQVGTIANGIASDVAYRAATGRKLPPRPRVATEEEEHAAGLVARAAREARNRMYAAAHDERCRRRKEKRAAAALARSTPKKPRGITHDGRTMTVKAWAREAGISYAALSTRLRQGMDVEQALARPVQICSLDEMQLTFREKTQSLKAWARELGLRPLLIEVRLAKGWSVEATLSRPAHRLAPAVVRLPAVATAAMSAGVP